MRALGSAALLLALAACGEDRHPLLAVQAGEAEVTGRGVLVVVVDGLRWDHTSLAGYDRETTPFLAALAREGYSFDDCWTPYPGLLGAHVALLSGCDPVLARRPPLRRADGSHALPAMAWIVPREMPLLAVSFLRAGWTTAAFVDHAALAGMRGFDTGFRDYVEFGGEERARDPRRIGVYGVGRRFIEWLNERPLDQDWFAYVHMNDLERAWSEDVAIPAEWTPRPELDAVPPRSPVEPVVHAIPPSRADDGHRSLAEYELHYDAALRALDGSLARLLRLVGDYGRWETTTVVVVGSHGVELGEGGLYLTAGLPEAADLHVPLIVRPAGGLGLAPPSGGARVDALVSLLDVAPTVLELAGVPPEPAMHGLSLEPLLRGEADRVRARTFVTGALGGGLAVIEEDRVLARLLPGGGGPLTASWYGDHRSHEGEVVELLAPRPPPGEPFGLQGARITDPRAASDLRELWLRWRGRAAAHRDALHFPEQDADRGDPEELRRLQTDPDPRAGGDG